MSDYKSEFKCDKVVRASRRHTYKCLKSPARWIPILSTHLCKEHQEEMSRGICEYLGEDYNDLPK